MPKQNPFTNTGPFEVRLSEAVFVQHHLFRAIAMQCNALRTLIPPIKTRIFGQTISLTKDKSENLI